MLLSMESASVPPAPRRVGAPATGTRVYDPRRRAIARTDSGKRGRAAAARLLYDCRMPTHEPELSEPYYGGEFYEGGYGNPDGAVVQYFYTEDDGFAYDPDAPGELEWLTEPVASGPEVDWADDTAKRKLGEAILRHRFDREATADELDLFMTELAPTLEAGIPFGITVGQLDNAGLRS